MCNTNKKHFFKNSNFISSVRRLLLLIIVLCCGKLFAPQATKAGAFLTILNKHAANDIENPVLLNNISGAFIRWHDNCNTSFSRRLVNALCGRLCAKEKPEVNKGTSFIFTIPEAA